MTLALVYRQQLIGKTNLLNATSVYPLVTADFQSGIYTSNGTIVSFASLPGWSFSNSTGGYSLNGATSFAANTPRITSAGLLIEGAGTNYALGSSNIAGGPLASTTSVTLTANAVTAPDGTLTATQVLDQAAGTSPQVQGNTPTPATVLGDIYTVSMFVNPGGERYVALSMTNNSGSVTRHTALFDLVTATCIGTDVYSGGTLPYDTFVTPSASGWFRIGFTITVDALLAGSTLGPRFWLDQPGAALSGQAPPPYTVVGTPSIYVWGWQVEKAASASSYMRSTTSVSGTRAADVASLTYSGTATSIRVGYASGTATPATGSPLNLGASSGGAWVGKNIQSIAINQPGQGLAYVVTGVSTSTANKITGTVVNPLTVSANSTSTSTVGKLIAHAVANNVTQIASLIRQIRKLLPLNTVQSSQIVKSIGHAVTNAATQASSAFRSFALTFAGQAGQTSTVNQTKIKLISAAALATQISTLGRAVGHIVTNNATQISTRIVSIAKSIANSATQVAAATTTRVKLVSAVATASQISTVVRQILRTIAVSAASAALSVQTTGKRIAAIASQTSIVGRGIARIITSTSSQISSIVAVRARLQTISAIASQASRVVFSTAHLVAYSVGQISNRTVTIAKTIAGSATQASSVFRSLARKLTANASQISAIGIGKAYLRSATAIASQVSTSGRAIAHAVTLAATVPANIIRTISSRITALASSSSSTTPARRRNVSAGVSAAAVWLITTIKTYRPSVRKIIFGRSNRIALSGRSSRETIKGQSSRSNVSGKSK
jgi:hypothetical protein